jgi:hypothetical protein
MRLPLSHNPTAAPPPPNASPSCSPCQHPPTAVAHPHLRGTAAWQCRGVAPPTGVVAPYQAQWQFSSEILGETRVLDLLKTKYLSPLTRSQHSGPRFCTFSIRPAILTPLTSACHQRSAVHLPPHSASHWWLLQLENHDLGHLITLVFIGSSTSFTSPFPWCTGLALVYRSRTRVLGKVRAVPQLAATTSS